MDFCFFYDFSVATTAISSFTATIMLSIERKDDGAHHVHI